MIRIILAFFAVSLLAACASENLPRGMHKVEVDEIYMSTENGAQSVQKLEKISVRQVVPESCGVAEVDYKYKSTETRLVGGRAVMVEKLETIPVRRLFCPPGAYLAPAASQRGAPQAPNQTLQPVYRPRNDMQGVMCGSDWSRFEGVRELFGCPR